MNLIEQLGGYEAAKGLFNLYEYSIGFKYYKVFKGDFESAGYIDVFIPDLQKALLEYRRQHNIFEVGDSVLPISNYSDQVHFLADWYIENLDFRYTTNSGSWGIIVKSLMDGAWRHATNEEIKAGKRLEVNQ